MKKMSALMAAFAAVAASAATVEVKMLEGESWWGGAAKYSEIGMSFPLNEYRTVWGFAGQPLVLRLADKRHTWRDLGRLIPDMTAMGLAGYPFVCPDMIGGGQVSSFIPGAPSFEQEMFVRSA
jgi:hypothetical protein